jgi:hypothetical protein
VTGDERSEEGSKAVMGVAGTAGDSEYSTVLVVRRPSLRRHLLNARKSKMNKS